MTGSSSSRRALLWAASLATGFAGCSSDGGGGKGNPKEPDSADAASPGGRGGESPTGAGGTGGSPAAGGVTSSGGATSPGSGGRSTGGTTAGGATSLGGAATGGAAPEAEAGPVPAKKSAGCGSAPPARGTLSFRVADQAAEYVLSIPGGYDENSPYPLGFAFHGRNRTGPNCHDGDCAGFQSVMEDHAVLVYMTALGGNLGWEGDGEREINVQYFQELLAQLEETLCIDETAIFVAGTSSGAHFTNVLACRFGDRLLAASPVAGYLPEKNGCQGEVSALVIHGVDDSHVAFSSGEEARDFFVSRNGCTSNAVPPVAELHDRVVANRESHECAAYQGCDTGKPVVWCEHSEGGYDGSTHGWPKFGGQQIWDFVQSLR